ncbi:methyltransferase domain-containing protein [Propionivibrio sp.]|uniref:class I SAM-dependent methyltransferase n=1 Tax=Propionivibrio sp. TaxID=2212460 RepID=UPI002608CB9A|nr:methyltransferase domain-containing protein [Propionivibrio sp.]
MASPEIIKLAEARVESFDHDATAVHAVAPVVDAIRRLSSLNNNFKLLDVGGGNGSFLDTMLKALPESTGTLVEMSKGMADKNETCDRKTIVCENFLEWAKATEKCSARYDVIFFNFVLHHFVGNNRSQSILLQKTAINAAQSILADGGLIVVYEIHYNGLFQDEIPSRLIHTLASSRILAPLTRRMGANTAGYGVCFHSERYWRSLYSRHGLRIVDDHLIEKGVFTGIRSRLLQILLNISSMTYKIHFLQSVNSP